MLDTTDAIENVVVVVGDAVRWDATVDRLSGLGPTYRTIAASLHTPTSFATMFSGLPPNRHGVYGFGERLPEPDRSIFGLADRDVSFGPGYMNDWVTTHQRIFGPRPGRPLAEMEPPFVWLTRDGGGHAPYDGFAPDGQTITGPDAKAYLSEAAGDLQRLRRDYHGAIDAFHDRVERIRDDLADRGLLDSTLLVVTSDHGELLGERGQIGHDFPAAPPLVYVPTTFVHPSLDAGTVDGGVMRHVDLLPTILGALGEEIPDSLPGRDLTHAEPAAHGVTDYNRSFSDFVRVGLRSLPGGSHVPVDRLPEIRLTLRGVWDDGGGHVFSESGAAERWLTLALRILATPEGKHARSHGSAPQLVAELSRAHRVYGDPSLTHPEAHRILRRYDEGRVDVRADAELDDSSMERLAELGYV